MFCLILTQTEGAILSTALFVPHTSWDKTKTKSKTLVEFESVPAQITPHLVLQDMDTSSNLAALIS